MFTARTRPCTGVYTGRKDGSIHGPHTAMCGLYAAVYTVRTRYTAMYGHVQGARPCTRPSTL